MRTRIMEQTKSYVIRYVVSTASRDYFGEFEVYDDLFESLNKAKIEFTKLMNKESSKQFKFGNKSITYPYIKVMKVNPNHKGQYYDYIGFVHKLYRIDSTGKIYCTRNTKIARIELEDEFKHKIPRKRKKYLKTHPWNPRLRVTNEGWTEII